jgi:LemA protein
MNIGPLVLIIIALIIIGCAIGWTIISRVKVYNDIVTKKNKVKNSWGHVEVQLQRRFDLVPSLVETVKGYTMHERQILDNVTDVLKQYANANTSKEKLAVDAKLTEYLTSLYNIANNYPQLKSNEQFLKLQLSLAELEEDISYARQFYNDAVTIYNNAIMTSPGNRIAAKHGFEEEFLFKAAPEATTPPKIQLQYTTKNQCPICGASVSNEDVNCKYCGGSLV